MPKRQPSRNGLPQTAEDIKEERAELVHTHLDRLLDEALAGTFPASDPVSTLVSEERPRSDS
jgi:hypothetical protein